MRERGRNIHRTHPLVGALDMLEGFVQHRFQRFEALTETALGEAEDPLLGPVEQLVYITLPFVGAVGDF